MRKSSLSVLAASVALIPSGAFAQTPPPGASFQAGVAGPQMAPQMMAPQMAQMMPPVGVPHRLQRGALINPFWMGPQFGISNWQAYGFADPGPGRRWIRYYDDAYLVDGTGRVVETRGGLDWDQYGEQWDMVNGVPAYRGARDFHPGAQDYAWHAAQGATAYPQGYGYAQGYGQGYGAAMPGYGYGQGYGYTQVYGGSYGYGAYAYPIVIETVSSGAASAAYSEEIIEEYVEVRQARRRPRRPCRCAPPPRRPPPGERG